MLLRTEVVSKFCLGSLFAPRFLPHGLSQMHDIRPLGWLFGLSIAITADTMSTFSVLVQDACVLYTYRSCGSKRGFQMDVSTETHNIMTIQRLDPALECCCACRTLCQVQLPTPRFIDKATWPLHTQRERERERETRARRHTHTHTHTHTRARARTINNNNK